MYFVYVDASGEANPTAEREVPYVLMATCIHEHQWKKFEAVINARKLALGDQIYRRAYVPLDLADMEIHSVDIRIPGKRATHKFLRHLSSAELNSLVDLYYAQLRAHHLTLFSVVVDKPSLHGHMDRDKVLRKAHELLLERVERFLATNHPKQRAVFVLDNHSKEANRSVAMKHAFFQRDGTTSGVRLRHIIELPFFVESYLSNGIQLTDLCAYGVMRAFRSHDSRYEHFRRLLPYFHVNTARGRNKVEGIKIFPESERWSEFLGRVEKERARLITENRAHSQMESSGAGPIEPP